MYKQGHEYFPVNLSFKSAAALQPYEYTDAAPTFASRFECVGAGRCPTAWKLSHRALLPLEFP